MFHSVELLFVAHSVAQHTALTAALAADTDDALRAMQTRILLPPSSSSSSSSSSGSVCSTARGEFVLELRDNERLRRSDALAQLVALADRRGVDVVAAQVLDVGAVDGAADVDDVAFEAWDVAQLARVLALYVGCRDDAALGLVLNCYGESMALVRRVAYCAATATLTNTLDQTQRAWMMVCAQCEVLLWRFLFL